VVDPRGGDGRPAGDDGVPALERLGGLLERPPQRGDDRLQRAVDEHPRIGREEQRGHREPDAPADQRLEHARRGVALARRGLLERDEQDRRHRRLDDHELAAPEQDGGRHREQDHHADLGRPGADELDDEVGHGEAEHDAEHQLHRPLAPLPVARAERDHGGDRGERRPLVRQQQVRQVPRRDGGERGLRDRQQARAQALRRAADAAGDLPGSWGDGDGHRLSSWHPRGPRSARPMHNAPGRRRAARAARTSGAGRRLARARTRRETRAVSSAADVRFDRQDQLEKIEEGLLPGETVIAVYDGKGGGTGFIGITDRRVVLQDNSFAGKSVALTSVPYGKITAVSVVSDKSMLGKLISGSAVAIVAGGRTVRDRVPRRRQGAPRPRRDPQPDQLSPEGMAKRSTR
jgi:hypothetical protein